MPVRSKRIFLLYICLAVNYLATHANTVEGRVARSRRDVYDWISDLFGDYDSDESEEEQYLICRNCTVIVGQSNDTNTAAAPSTTLAPAEIAAHSVAPDAAGATTTAPPSVHSTPNVEPNAAASPKPTPAPTSQTPPPETANSSINPPPSDSTSDAASAAEKPVK